MPIYEYKCSSCGEVTEMMEKITSDQNQKECPKCGGEASRIMSVTSFQLKGGGWYNQGYDNASACSSKDSSSEKCATCPAANS
ncbi:FmdB family zinc ribbon protein [Limisalsivibrio acetivorans]|uniref:FmdB family zinc ribbon protein n=1 Tax=Limisalsivibrio acetivorans TaxID=1304888 RepID=UPI0003B6E30C|nr:zinc ribbon domain-containing protein [Limisalsivibrio acetivorans]